MFENIPPDTPMRQRCLRALRKAGGETGLLPSCYQVLFELEMQGALPAAAGGFSDVWKANSQSGTNYALKILRVTQQDNIKEMKKVRAFLHRFGPWCLIFMCPSAIL